MDRDRRIRIYDLHAWTGITLGLFMFIVSFTGCLALFFHELQTWEDSARRLILPAKLAPIHDTLEDWIKTKPQNLKINFLGVEYPRQHEPYYSARIFLKGNNGETANFSQRWNAETLEVIPPRGEGLAIWLLDFHRDLMWPESLGGRTVGRSLVGVAGIILMLSIITGLVTHRKMFKELFKFRINRSIRVKWKDAHNFLGLWGLPFYSMIAFTGAFLGIVAILVPLTGVLVAKGDTEKLRNVISPVSIELSGVSAPMLSFDAVYQRLYEDTGQAPSSVFVSNWGDETAVYQINYLADTELLRFESIAINVVSGELIEDRGFLKRTVTNRTLRAIAPLHYGTYGGIALKILYLVLGLSLCVMIVLGIMVWLERRMHSSEGKQSVHFYRRLGQLTIGVTLGNVVASVAIFYLDKLYVGEEATRLTWTALTYFLTWLFIIAYAFSHHNGYRITRQLFALIGVSLLGLPLLNGLITNDFLVAIFSQTPISSHWVDVSLLFSGVIICVTTFYLPKTRQHSAKAKLK